MRAGRLLIGPLLRRVVGTRATVWVETSAPAVVTVRAANGASGTAPTFSAYNHHYALVVVEGLKHVIVLMICSPNLYFLIS